MATRLHGRLTAKEIQHATKRGVYPDGGGLLFQISRNGSRSWIFRFRVGTKRRYLGLGAARDVSLAEARTRAATARAMLAAGQDPIDARAGRRAAALLTSVKTVTFREAAASFIQAGVTAKSVGQWKSSIDIYADPIIGALSVAAIDTGLVLKVVEPMWTTKTETASRLLRRIERILDWSKVRGYRDGENPARWSGHLENLLQRKNKVAKVEHHAALPYSEMSTFMTQLRGVPGMAARALEFAILTASRSGEVFGARWEELDLGAKVWAVPGVRMKSGRGHRVPLSDQAVELLGALPAPHDGIIFQGPRAGFPLSKMAMLDVLERMGRTGVTVHGFRSAFRDWAGDRTEYARDVIEAALAHAIGDKTEAAYRRLDALEKRARLMQAWANVCSGKAQASAEVIELKRA